MYTMTIKTNIKLSPTLQIAATAKEMHMGEKTRVEAAKVARREIKHPDIANAIR